MEQCIMVSVWVEYRVYNVYSIKSLGQNPTMYKNLICVSVWKRDRQ